MCGKGSQTQTSTSAPSPQAMQLYQDLLTRAQGVAGTPYTPYGGELVAPNNAQQNMGIAGINANADFALPNIQNALGMATSAAQPITAQQIQQYTNPYTSSVVNATQAQFNNQNQQQQQQVLGNAISQGALGGNRTAIALSELANQQQLAQAPVIAGLRSQGYQQGVSTALAEQAALGQGAYSVGNLGVAGENAGLTGANAQIGAGTLQQQTQQAQDAAAYQQFLNQQAYPFQTTQWLAGIGTGVGSQMGGTSSTTGPAPNQTAQWLGTGIAAAGLFLNKGGRVNEGVAGRDGGGGVNYQTFGGGFGTPVVPYSGGKSWVPSMGITHGAGAPRPPGLPNQQGPDLSKQISQVQGLAGKLSNSDGSFNLSQLSAPSLIGSGEYVGPLGYAPEGEARGGVVGYADGGDAGDISIPPDFVDRFSGDNSGVAPADFNSRFSGDISPVLPQVPLGNLSGKGFDDSVAPTAGVTPTVPAEETPVAPAAPISAGIIPVADKTAYPQALPRGLRNNNPGNIEDGDFARSQPGYKGTDGRFAIFESPEAGIAAQSNLLRAYGNKGINTLSGIINRWAPAADNNNTNAYIAAVSKMTGIDPHQPLDMSDPNVRMKIATAIGKYENGTGAISQDAMLARNYNRAAGLVPSEAALPFTARTAQYQGDQPSQGILPKNLFNLAGVSPEIKRALLSAGFGMMASRSPFLGTAIGEGAEQGLSTYGAMQQQEATRALAQRKIDLEAQKLSQEADRWQKDYQLKTLPYQGVMTAEQKAELGLKQQAQAETTRQHAMENLKPVQVGIGAMGPIYAVRDPVSGGYRVIDPETGKPGSVIGAPAGGTASNSPAAASASQPLPAIPAQTAPGQPTLQSVAVQPVDPNKFAPPELVRTAFGASDDVAAPLRNVFDADSKSTAGMNLQALDNDPNVAKDPGLRNRIIAVASGRAPIPPTTGRASYLNQYIAKKAYEVNPMLDGTTFQRRQRTENFYAVGTQGGGGQNIVAINRWLAHSGSLLALAEKMGMGDYTTLNDLKIGLARRGLWTKELQDQLGAWDINAQGVAGEAAKVFAGSNPALADRQEWLNVLSPNTPLHTIRAKLQQAADMGAQALAANVANYNEGMRTNHNPREFLTPRSRQILDALEKGQTVSSLTPPAGGTGAAPAAATQRTLSPLDQQALGWAKANPNDPKAAAILQRLGVQ